MDLFDFNAYEGPSQPTESSMGGNLSDMNPSTGDAFDAPTMNDMTVLDDYNSFGSMLYAEELYESTPMETTVAPVGFDDGNAQTGPSDFNVNLATPQNDIGLSSTQYQHGELPPYNPWELSPFHPLYQEPPQSATQNQQSSMGSQDLDRFSGEAEIDSGFGEGVVTQGGTDDGDWAFQVIRARTTGSNHSPSKRMQCDYSEDCKKLGRFASKESFSNHLEVHRQEVLRLWGPSKTCKWPGCKSRRTNTSFKTNGLFKKHLKTHIKVHWCDAEGCDYPTAFGTAFDLRRHQATAHSPIRNFFCTFNDCERTTLGFSRLDKLNEHIRDQHETYQCQFDHCRARVVEPEKESHINTAHKGNQGYFPNHIRGLIYECGFPGCVGTKSRFRYDTMEKHIVRDHEFSDSVYLSALMGRGEKYDDPNESRLVVSVLYPKDHNLKGHQHCLTCLQKKSLSA